MKKWISFCCLLLTVHLAAAQNITNANGGKDGKLKGKLVDAAGAGIDFATIMIFPGTVDSTAINQQVLAGATTDSTGFFEVGELPLNTPMRLRASGTGLSELNTKVTLTDATSIKDLGQLQMNKTRNALKGVTVTAITPYMTMDMDKKVYNATRDIVSIGGTGLDVLKNVPGVNVDIDGNVSMRGASPQIFVDGKPTILTLDQIPANTIESVEVMNNPSAKYDASGGGAGILNVVLKKNKKAGYNGSVRAGIDSHLGMNGGGSISLKTRKFNISADVNARKGLDYTSAATNRLNFGADPAIGLNQSQLDTADHRMIFDKLSMDYNITDRTSLSLSAFAMRHNNTGTSDINILADTISNLSTVSSSNYEHIGSSRSFNGKGVTLGFKHNFKKQKEVWTIDANLFSGKASSLSQYATSFYSDAAGGTLTGTQLQKIEGSGSDYNIIVQSDYTNPLSSKMTLEAGVRAAIQNRKNNNYNFIYNSNTDVYDLIPTAASNYKSQSSVYAAYTTLAGTLDKFTYKAGLRLESSGYSGTLLNSNESFSNKFPLSLFPSLFLGRKLGEGQDIQLNYTRRVNRPNFFQLMPYTDASNPLNITRGNPNLVPEFTQSVELSYLKSFDRKATLMGSLYYKYTDHLITGYIASDTSASGDVSYVNTYVNARSSYSLGAELTGQFTLAKWWDFTANFNIYQSKINLAGGNSGSQQSALWSWFGKVNSNFKLPAGFGLQLTASYQSKANLPVNSNSNRPGPPDMQSQAASQGYINPYYFVDLAVKKEFYKGKLVASLSVNDIFKSRKQVQYTYSDYFSQDYTRLRNPQMLRLNLTYNFGKQDLKSFDKKKSEEMLMEH